VRPFVGILSEIIEALQNYYKVIIKEIRAGLRLYTGRFQKSRKSRERLLTNSEISKILETHFSTKERMPSKTEEKVSEAPRANITPRHITGNFTAGNKTYDGNNSAIVLTRTLNDVVPGDDVSLIGGIATFNDKNVANGKIVTLTGASLAGKDPIIAKFTG
jgi:hypothetical protein